MMLAFLYSEDDCGGSCGIAFGLDEAAAREYAVKEMGSDLRPEEIYEMIRRPEFDVYAPGPMPVEVLIDNGWSFHCWHCEHTCSDDGCYECEEEDGDFSPPYFANNNVYCSKKCYDAERYECAIKSSRKENTKTMFLMSYPFCEVERMWIGSFGSECQCFRTDHYNTMLTFKFPGMATRHKGEFCSGCKRVWLSPADHDLFMKLFSESRP